MNKIRRRIAINGAVQWISANTEQEYADILVKIAMESAKKAEKHNFREYAMNWFELYAKPNIAAVTAETYFRQLVKYILPSFGGMDIEDISADHIQRLFNGMDVSKASKEKTRMVLNMIFAMAMDDDILQKNPMASKRLKISGRESEPTEVYSVERMQYLVQNLDKIKSPTDKAYMALQSLHPMRLEEVLGLQWRDIDLEKMEIHICRAVTHPTRNMPEIKMPKTKASVRVIGLSKIAASYLAGGAGDRFVLGGERPLSYTQVRRMCERIRRDVDFPERIVPIRFRTTVLTDIYDQTRDIKQAQAAAGHTTSDMTLKYYVKGRGENRDAVEATERVYSRESR